MEAVGLRESRLILQNEGNLNNTRKTRAHESIPEDRVNHSTDHQLLSMSGHRIPSKHDNNSGDKVALRPTTATATEPHTQQTRTPPNNTHSSMLEIIMNPRATPAMLSESIDTTPSSNNERIEELLTAPRLPQPILTNKQ